MLVSLLLVNLYIFILSIYFIYSIIFYLFFIYFKLNVGNKTKLNFKYNYYCRSFNAF